MLNSKSNIFTATNINEYQWAAWEEWTSCSVSCGTGNKNRTRKCLEPIVGGIRCPNLEPANENLWWQNLTCGTSICPGMKMETVKISLTLTFCYKEFPNMYYHIS